MCWRGRTSSGACLWRRFDVTAGPCWLTESTPLTSTQLFARRLVRHIVTAIRPVGGDTSSLHVTANFVVLETLVDEQTKVHSAGAYRDRIVATADGPRFAEKEAVYDAPLVPTSLIVPL